MSNFSQDTVNTYIESIRSIISTNPRATLQEITDTLKKEKGISIGLRYAMKLRQKIYQERKYRFNQATILVRIAEMEDRYRKLQSELWPIILDKKARPVDRVAAAKVLATTEKDLLEAQMNAGIFERKLGTVDFKTDVEKFKPILNAFQNFGFIKKANVIKIEKQLSDGGK